MSPCCLTRQPPSLSHSVVLAWSRLSSKDALRCFLTHSPHQPRLWSLREGPHSMHLSRLLPRVLTVLPEPELQCNNSQTRPIDSSHLSGLKPPLLVQQAGGFPAF